MMMVDSGSGDAFDAARVASELTPAQRKAMLAIDRPYGRVRWVTDQWSLRSTIVNGVAVSAMVQSKLMDKGLIWAKMGIVGYLPNGKAVRAALVEATK